MLEYVSSPIAEVAQRQPQFITSWVQKYGAPLYVTAVADYTLDFQVPALRSAGVDPKLVKLVGADGQRSAYERIRSGEYQVVTVSEPVRCRPIRRWTRSTALSRANRRAASCRRLIWSRPTT